MKLPAKFEERMKELLGAEYEEYLRCYSKPHYGGLRVNTLKISPEEFEKICPFTIKRIPWTSNGYYYDSKEQPARHPYYYAGLYYIQEPSAMTPASLLPVTPGDKVLDICAAPGGKSTELGAKLKGEGLLVSNDISNSRAKALLKNIELFGIRNPLVLSEAPNKLADYFPGYFDKILIDAPCSGEGMFRKSPAIMKNWEQYGVEYYNKLQKEIILFAAKMLKPGGMMLYSTCTFSPEENEGTLAFLLEQCPEFKVIRALPSDETVKELGLSYEGFDFGKPEWLDHEVSEDVAEQIRHSIRLWPHKIDGEGHFIALLQKDADAVIDYSINPSRSKGKGNSNRNKTAISEEAYDFLQELAIFGESCDIRSYHRLETHEDRIHLLAEGLPDLTGLRIMRNGLLLGEMKKQRFEPSQALANALIKSDYKKTISFDGNGQEAIRYLKCESIEIENAVADGWQLICADEFPLGWGKLAKGNFKNKYLPGWRWM